MMREIGSMIESQYEVLAVAGRGGMATVYRVRDHKLERELAIKEIEKHHPDQAQSVITQTAMAEIHLLKNLTHVGLTYLIDLIETEQSLLIVMEYVDGISLDCLLKSQGAQAESDVIEWGKQLCGVLHYLHTRKPPIIYRDVKPGNIRLQPDGLIKLLDFGIARTYKQAQPQDTVCLGTKGYAAPEQFAGQGQTDPRTDVYGVGVTLYQLVTGRSPGEEPYVIEPIRRINPSLSAGLEQILLTCTHPKPDKRYQSCDALRHALEHVRQLDLDARYRKKRKLWQFFAACAGFLVSLSMGCSGLFLYREENLARYQHYLELATLSTRTADAMTYYQQAIALQPKKIDAYLGLIEQAKKDGQFRIEEEAMLKSIFYQQEESISQSKDAGRLALEMGQLYWYHFSYGRQGSPEHDLVRMQTSLEWFQRVILMRDVSVQDRKTAMLYRDIGEFYVEMKNAALTPPEPLSYQRRFHDLLEAMSLLLSDPVIVEETLLLSFYQLSVDALSGYASELLTDGVSREAMVSFANQVFQQTKALAPSTEQSQQHKDKILAREEEVHQQIQKSRVIDPQQGGEDRRETEQEGA